MAQAREAGCELRGPPPTKSVAFYRAAPRCSAAHRGTRCVGATHRRVGDDQGTRVLRQDGVQSERGFAFGLMGNSVAYFYLWFMWRWFIVFLLPDREDGAAAADCSPDCWSAAGFKSCTPATHQYMHEFFFLGRQRKRTCSPFVSWSEDGFQCLM